MRPPEHAPLTGIWRIFMDRGLNQLKRIPKALTGWWSVTARLYRHAITTVFTG